MVARNEIDMLRGGVSMVKVIVGFGSIWAAKPEGAFGLHVLQARDRDVGQGAMDQVRGEQLAKAGICVCFWVIEKVVTDFSHGFVTTSFRGSEHSHDGTRGDIPRLQGIAVLREFGVQLIQAATKKKP